jgi:hypothetical protein
MRINFWTSRALLAGVIIRIRGGESPVDQQGEVMLVTESAPGNEGMATVSFPR